MMKSMINEIKSKVAINYKTCYVNNEGISNNYYKT